MSKYKILLVGQYKSLYDGWSDATRSLIKSIQTISNIDLTIRNIDMANKPKSNIKEFEDLTYGKGPFDVVLQKVLPNLFCHDSSFGQNIGLCVFESILPKHHQYIYRISSLLDKVTVTSNIESNWLSKYTTTPVFPIGEAIDIYKYKKIFDPIHPIFQDKNIFKFLFTGEDTERKNLQALIRAYLNEFNINENIALIIKTNTDVGPKIDKIKQSLRKSFAGRYPIVCLIAGQIAEEQMNSLYQHSDCLVVPSKGESFCRGAAEMIAAGKPVISTKDIGTGEFIHEGGWLVDSHEETCYCESPPIYELYTSTEKWQEISIIDLQRCMREAFSQRDIYNQKCQNIKHFDLASQFSYETIGQSLLRTIEA